MTHELNPIVYLNGEFIPLDKANISVLDRGFIFGDGVYEAIPTYAKKPFRVKHHLERLNNSLNAIQIKNPLSFTQWQQLIKQLIHKNNYLDQYIYLQITRGVAPRNHAFPHQESPTIFMMTSPLEKQSQEVIENGISVVSLPDNRWQNCQIKSISLLPNVLLQQQALDKGAKEAILIRDGLATEGSASNLFIVLDDCLITPPKGPLLLPGVTRDLIVEIAHEQAICIKEHSITETELMNAQEIWLTSSTKEILPVTRLNDKIISNGRPGRHWHKMIKTYHAYIQDL
ncbi:MAG: D-amino acid aminotransferase [Gammaproteobacteria bacterium]|nr:D-amino acid aminotransferase [Gammaproteobacteria bacterium]